MANANVTFIETSSANLASLPIVDGAIIYVIDQHLLYRDTSSERVPIGSAHLAVARTIALSGDATGSVDFDGSQNVELPIALKNSTIIPGNYGPEESRTLNYGDSFEVPQLAFDIKGRAIAGTSKFFTLPNATAGGGQKVVISDNQPEINTNDLWLQVE